MHRREPSALPTERSTKCEVSQFPLCPFITPPHPETPRSVRTECRRVWSAETGLCRSSAPPRNEGLRPLARRQVCQSCFCSSPAPQRGAHCFLQVTHGAHRAGAGLQNASSRPFCASPRPRRCASTGVGGPWRSQGCVRRRVSPVPGVDRRGCAGGSGSFTGSPRRSTPGYQAPLRGSAGEPPAR